MIRFKKVSNSLIKPLRRSISKIEPYWTLVGAPVSQEIIFRFIPYQLFYLPTGNYWIVGLIASLLYSLIHWYFGILVTLGTFVLGIILWWVMVNFGLLPTILTHTVVNLFILLLLRDKWLKK